VFKQYRESDGRFYFKLVHGDRTLLQSQGHASPRDAGQLVARLKQSTGKEVHHIVDEGVHLGRELVGHLCEDAAIEEIISALALFAEDA
jgi:tryptophanyl-tRNA synthetase